MSELQTFIAARTPAGWETRPLWSLFRRQKLTGFADEELLSVYRDYGVIPKSSRDDNHNKESDDLSGYQLVTEGSLVTNKMKAWQGSIAISRYRGIVSPAYYVYKPLSEECDQFLHYLLRSDPYIALYGRISKGVRVNQWDLEHEALRNVPVMLPGLETQKAIVDFLDRETDRVDQLIKKKQELQLIIQLKSQALLERYFTFGLVADHQRKATGLPWLPTIPESWGITAIKRVVKVKDGTHETPSYVDADEKSFPLITSKDFIGDSIDFTNAKYISAEDHDLIYRRSNTEQGDVLMSMIGGNIGKSIIVMDERKFSIKNVALFKTGGNQQLAKQILLFLRSPLFNEQLRLIGRGGAQDFIGLGDIRNLMFPIIPEDELKELITEANAKIRDLSKVVDHVQFSISRLHEFRLALITAAVTGQIDVETWGKQGQTDRGLDQIEEDIALREARV
ncbi:restriction endonuclease subunit S [Marivita sp. S0852]|uniref:restriction endonuclease subunit S n=1 Tax=Marivita sp. S0852 TaxID=3373893 RepID=UPI003981DD93